VQAGTFINQLLQLPIRVEDETAERTLREVYGLARSTVLTAYDAGYLELAIRRHLPLATSDRALAATATEAGIIVLPQGA
jgi:predicted nucleic acid-binding protein